MNLHQADLADVASLPHHKRSISEHTSDSSRNIYSVADDSSGGGLDPDTVFITSTMFAAMNPRK